MRDHPGLRLKVVELGRSTGPYQVADTDQICEVLDHSQPLFCFLLLTQVELLPSLHLGVTQCLQSEKTAHFKRLHRVSE